ncbi:MAG: c-type cytochrome [Taibaiella sp.]|nr:c-type cytochrome [Taibaiella sp.]
MRAPRKFITIVALCLPVLAINTFAQKERGHEEMQPKNLQVLPKNTTGEDVHNIMKGYAKSLGVRCGFCHEAREQKGGGRPMMDFAGDAKPEKETARQMMRMVDAINTQYLNKMGGGHLEQVTCVTCHMGKTKPIISTDSLEEGK